jgi:hypothetical protein
VETFGLTAWQVWRPCHNRATVRRGSPTPPFFFGVDLSNIQFHKHFGPECGPILFMPCGLEEEMKDLGQYPVTVGHLIEVAEAKRWSGPPRHGEKPWPQLPPTSVWDRQVDGDTGSISGKPGS